MAISRTIFNPSLSLIVSVPFIFQGKAFSKGEPFPSKKVTAGVRQLKALYNSRKLNVEKGKEVDTPAMKRAKNKMPKKVAKKAAKKTKSNPWENSEPTN